MTTRTIPLLTPFPAACDGPLQHLWMTCPRLLVTPGLPVRIAGEDGLGDCFVLGLDSTGLPFMWSGVEHHCDASGLEVDLLNPHVRDYIARALVRVMTGQSNATLAGVFTRYKQPGSVWAIRVDCGPIKVIRFYAPPEVSLWPSPNEIQVRVPSLLSVDEEAPYLALGMIAWHALNPAEQGAEVAS